MAPLVGANLHEIFGMLPIFANQDVLRWRDWFWILGDVSEEFWVLRFLVLRILEKGFRRWRLVFCDARLKQPCGSFGELA